jgi:hypothetical protein
MITRNWHANCQTSFSGECPAKTQTPEGIYVKAEQRQQARYRIRDVEFQVFSHGIQESGSLVNISKGGLAFQFETGPGKMTECRVIDILGPEGKRFYLPGIACRLIYDIGVLAEGRTFTGAENRLRGVQFIGLIDEQNRKLTGLIDRYGIIV